MGSPNDRKYAESHEWHKVEGDVVVIGISQFAVDELTDVTFVDILKKSGPIKAGQSFGEVESVKATSEIYSGIDGEIVAVNQEVINNPGLLNEDPWDKGWLVKVKPANVASLDSLLDAAAYDKQHG
jgi:glycine cleavage system H protein